MEARKNSLVARLAATFDQWQQFLTSRTDQEWVSPRLPGGWSVTDVVLHLMAWQQISIARLEAALDNREPKLPSWLGGADPFYAEEHTDEFNAQILERYHMESWSSVYRAWQEGFLHFLELAKAIPEAKFFDANRYPWLHGYAVSEVVSGSCEHHEEHLEEFL